MKICIAGSRTFTNYSEFCKILDTCLDKKDLVIISGCAKGPDTMAINWATQHNISVIRMPADWEKYGKSAGCIRNIDMAKLADRVIVFWDGKSSGTRHMVVEARKLDKPVSIFEV